MASDTNIILTKFDEKLYLRQFVSEMFDSNCNKIVLNVLRNMSLSVVNHGNNILGSRLTQYLKLWPNRVASTCACSIAVFIGSAQNVGPSIWIPYWTPVWTPSGPLLDPFFGPPVCFLQENMRS